MNELDFTTDGYRGKVAYEAYAASTGGKTYDGRDMLKWSELGDRIQQAWAAAAKAVAAAVETSRGKS